MHVKPRSGETPEESALQTSSDQCLLPAGRYEFGAWDVLYHHPHWSVDCGEENIESGTPPGALGAFGAVRLDEPTPEPCVAVDIDDGGFTGKSTFSACGERLLDGVAGGSATTFWYATLVDEVGLPRDEACCVIYHELRRTGDPSAPQIIAGRDGSGAE